MWYLAQKLARSDVDRGATVSELLFGTAQNLLTWSVILLLVSTLFITGTWDSSRLPGLLLSMLVMGLIFFLAHHLIQRRLLSGILIWFVGYYLALLLGYWLFRNPAIIFVSSVLPLIAVLTVSPWAGLAAEVSLVGLVFSLSSAPGDLALPAELAWQTVFASLLIVLLAWLATRELLSTIQWSLQNYSQIRQELGDFRDRQVQLEQALEDLNLANRELARLSQRMKVLERIAEEARQAKTEFVANVSHELRTPLNMIIGYADLISRSPKVYGGQLPASLLTDIKAILRNAQHLSNLVNDVLDLSQVEAGRMALSRNWVAPQKTINEALTVVKGLFESKNLYLKSDVSADLPPVYYDEVRIRQVLINLLSNAGRFTEQGGVTLGCEATAREVVFRVSDTGPGIDAKDQERIFEPFQQANTSIRRRYGGSGLGLTISKQFIEMHGGKMWMESRLGSGTTFFFSLPKENEALPLLPGPNLMRSIIPDDQTGYRLRTHAFQAKHLPTTERYVLVDPEQTLQRLFPRYLPDAVLETAPEISAAVEALGQSPAQGLILNLPRSQSLPEVISNLPFGTPVFTCWMPGEHEAAQRLGAVEYLIKPVSQEKLLASLGQLGPTIKTVLIVDDEEDELHLFARHLEADERHYQLLQVTNGKRALSMLRTRHPDVMLLDLTMPGMSGFQVLEEKQGDPAIRDIPVIIISARDLSGDPIISDTFSVTCSSGLTQRNLVACFHALGEILAPISVAGNHEQ